MCIVVSQSNYVLNVTSIKGVTSFETQNSKIAQKGFGWFSNNRVLTTFHFKQRLLQTYVRMLRI